MKLLPAKAQPLPPGAGVGPHADLVIWDDPIGDRPELAASRWIFGRSYVHRATPGYPPDR